MKAEAFRIEVPEPKLKDLQRRLSDVNWPLDVENEDWGYGTQGTYLRELVDYWRDGFDWRAQERAMNAHEHYRVRIEGVPIHFMRVRGKGPDPLPLVLTQGGPGPFWFCPNVVGRRAAPAAHGGDPADAFDVVVPSLPGFTFSTPNETTGLNWWRTADLWVSLMRDVLGYGGFFAHGGDWGALVSMQLGHKYPEVTRGIHLSNAFPLPPFDEGRPWSIGDAALVLAQGEDALEQVRAWERKFASHVAVHMLDPQTLAYALHDSPVGLCAWILERRRAWGDCRGDVESRFSRDELLTTMSLYWLTDCFVSSVRYYREAALHPWRPSHDGMPAIAVPTGISVFEHDMPPGGSMDWSADYYQRVLLRVRDSGGHFAAAEEPEAIVNDIRESFRAQR